MANFVPPWPGDFESVARQYWNLWGDALRQAGVAPGVAPTTPPGWQQTVDWWSQLVPGGNAQVHDVLGRFQRQASDWFGQMQQVAAQFVGRDPAPADIGRAWREALGMADPQPARNPFADIFRAMQGGAHGLDGWMEQARPYLESMQREGSRWLHVPAFGLSREHQERWQHLAQAQQDYQQQLAEYDLLMLKVAQNAFERFERKLEDHAAPGKQLETARALFDLWIDAAEEAYAQIALSDEFRRAYGALANAQARVRLAVQREVEQVCALFGMPTRTEVDAAHRKIVELERALRKAARAQPAAAGQAPVREPAPQEAAPRRESETVAPPAAKATRPPARRKPAKKSATRKRPAAAKRVAKKATRRAATATAPAAKREERPAKTAKVRKAVAKKKPAPKKASVAKPAPKKPARRVSKPTGPASSAPLPNSVVSMKDWVARNATRANASEAAPASKKKKAKRGSRK